MSGPRRLGAAAAPRCSLVVRVLVLLVLEPADALALVLERRRGEALPADLLAPILRRNLGLAVASGNDARVDAESDLLCGVERGCDRDEQRVRAVAGGDGVRGCGGAGDRRAEAAVRVAA